MKTKILDRFYIEDKDGQIFRVVGEQHPDDFIAGYLRYFPTLLGDREYNKKRYGRNDFVYNTFGLVKNPLDNISFSDYHGGCVIGIKKENIAKVFNSVDVLKAIIENHSQDLLNPQKLLYDLIKRIYAEVLAEGDIGITGSFLPGLNNANSDLDFVVYGKKQTIALKKWLDKENILQPYEGELAGEIYFRRMKYLPDTDIKTLVRQEHRKLQGKANGIHVNFQPLRNEGERKKYVNTKYDPIGSISLIAEIIDESESIFSPAIYQISCKKVLISESSIAKYIQKEINWLVSFLGLYSNTFSVGEEVYINGTLVRVTHNGKIFFGILLDPWGYHSTHSAKLI